MSNVEGRERERKWENDGSEITSTYSSAYRKQVSSWCIHTVAYQCFSILFYFVHKFNGINAYTSNHIINNPSHCWKYQAANKYLTKVYAFEIKRNNHQIVIPFINSHTPMSIRWITVVEFKQTLIRNCVSVYELDWCVVTKNKNLFIFIMCSIFRPISKRLVKVLWLEWFNALRTSDDIKQSKLVSFYLDKQINLSFMWQLTVIL